MELRFLVPQGQPGFAVAAIPCVDGRKRDLHVLLRHRLRSISLKGAAVRPKRWLGDGAESEPLAALSFIVS